MKKKVVKSVIFGVFYSFVGLFVGLYIRETSIGDYSDFPYYSTFGAFSASVLLWYLCVERNNKHYPQKGIFAGFLSGVVSHYFCWYSFLCVANFQFYILNMQIGSSSEPPIDPFLGLFAMLLYTVISFLFFGFITAPLGAIIGYIYGFLLYKNNKETTQQVNELGSH